MRLVIVSVLSLLALSCGSTTRTTCDAALCPTGCCNPTSGKCEAGTSPDFCGSGGASCASCGDEQRCVAGACADGPPPTTFWYKDVLPITQQRCQSCHRTGGIAPFSLETYESAKPMAEAMKNAVQARRMPPWMPSASCGTPFLDDRSLSQAQIDTISRWADERAPAGNPADAPPAPGPVGQLARIDATLAMPEAYTPSTARTDDYRCFLVDPELSGNRFVTGFDVQPGVPAEVHHVIIYIVDRAAARTKDASEAGAGWTCFGDSGLQSPGPIGAWAPGTGAVTYPAGTGIQLTANQALAMQIHYNTTNSRGTPDLTSVKIMYAAAGAQVTQAYLLPLVANRFAIPPGATGYNYSQTFPNSVRLPIRVWGLMPHMHTLGKRITMTHGNECLVDIPRWDFHWQQQYFRPQPFTVPGNGGITLSCTWDNPTTRTVRWGEGTEDEMCFAYIYATL